MVEDPSLGDEGIRAGMLTEENPVAGVVRTVAAAQPLLRNRHFLLLWLAQILSQTAQNALLLGLLVLVQRRGQSPTHLSLVTFSLIMPSVLFSMLAGVAVDHLNKKSVLVSANVLRALASLLFILLDRNLLFIYVVAFLFSSIGQFFAPAEAAAIPMLVHKRQLITANALFNLTLSATQLLGLVILAPLLIKLIGLGGFFLVLLVLFALAAFCVSFLPPDRQEWVGFSGREGGRMVRQVWAELVEGWRILRANYMAALAMVYLTIALSLVPLLAVLGPVFTVAVIHANAEDVVYLLAPAGIAMILATALLGRLTATVSKLQLMIAGLVSMGVTLMLLAMAKTGGGYILYNLIGRVLDTRQVALELIPIVMILSFALGIEYVCVLVPAQTLLQENCPPAFRGRIFGVQFTLAGVGSLLPLLGAGAFAHFFGVNKTIFLIGAIILLIGLWTTQRLPFMEKEAVD